MSDLGAGVSSEVPRPVHRGLSARFSPLHSQRQGSGRMRLIETTLLALAGLFLAIATVNDLVRQTNVNHRLVVDLRTWRAYTGHDYHELTIEQDIHGHSTSEVVCGNTVPGGPKQRVQLCLQITGPVAHGVRAVHAGWYLPPNAEDLRAQRYGCFGSAVSQGRCPR
jgi:hypothetical protein